jgi:hypothetical protein
MVKIYTGVFRSAATAKILMAVLHRHVTHPKKVRNSRALTGTRRSERAALPVILYVIGSIRVLRQYERGVVFLLGKFEGVRDGAQGYAHHLLDGKENKGEPRPAKLRPKRTRPSSSQRNL